MAQTAAHLVDHVIPHVPVRQWVLSLPIPLRLLLAAQPKLVTPVLQVVHRVIRRHLLGQAGLKADEVDSGAVTLIQRFGSAANFNIHLHCLVLDGVYRPGTDGAPVFVEVSEPTDEQLQAVLHKIITRLTQAAHPSGGAGRRRGRFDIYGRQRRRFGRGPHAQAAAGGGVYLPHRLRPARRPEGADGARRHAKREGIQAGPVRRHRVSACTRQCAAAAMIAKCWNKVPHHHPPALQADPGQRTGPSSGTNSPLDCLCPGSALANERVQTNATGQVVPKLKTPWRDAHHAPGHVAIGVYAAAGGTGDPRAPSGCSCHARDCT